MLRHIVLLTRLSVSNQGCISSCNKEINDLNLIYPIFLSDCTPFTNICLSINNALCTCGISSQTEDKNFRSN